MDAFTRSTWSFVAALTLSAALQAQDSYRLQRVSEEPAGVTVSDLNNRGELVGSISRNDGTVRGFVWRNGQITDIGDLEGGSADYAEAIGINNRSVIVGVTIAGPDFRFRPLIRERGEIEDLGVFPDASAVFAVDVNDRGEVIGDVDNQAFVLSRDEVRILDGLPGAGPSFPEAINILGVIAGFSDSAQGRRAVIWEQGVIRDLGSLPGDVVSRAFDINDRGQVVGTAGTARAFLWEDGQLQELPGLLPAEDWIISAASINNRGHIVGMAFSRRSPSQVPLLWQDASLYDLNDLVDAADPLKPYVQLLGARLINRRGQIVAIGADSRAPNFRAVPYLLTPLGDGDDDDDDD